LSYPSATAPIFDLISDFTFSLSGNNSTAVKFKIQVHSDPPVGNDLKEYLPNWNSVIMVSPTGSLMPFKAGSDFGWILDCRDNDGINCAYGRRAKPNIHD
ncbi:hypothetical protein BGZ98_005957, partial [Dissophora globulifera]